MTDTWTEHTRWGAWLRDYQARRLAAATPPDEPVISLAGTDGSPRAVAAHRGKPTHRLARRAGK